MKKNNKFTLLLIQFLLMPFLSKAQTVTNIEYIRKEIAVLSNDSDYSYDEIEAVFSDYPAFKTRCFYNERRSSSSRDQDLVDYLGKLDETPLEFLIDFELSEQELGFNIEAKLTPKNRVTEYFTHAKSIECVPSLRGCAYFTFEKNQVFHPMDEFNNKVVVKVENNQKFTTYIKNPDTFYLEFSVDLLVSTDKFLRPGNDEDGYSKSYLCEMKRVSNKFDI